MRKSQHNKCRSLPAVIAAILILSSNQMVYAAETGGDGSREGTTQASVAFKAGELKLVSVPTLDFGSHDVSPQEESFTAAAVSDPVQVSDLRGSGKGWELMVSLSQFKLTEGDYPTLKAASIQVLNPAVNAVNNNLGTPPETLSELVLTSDNTETRVFTADVNKGMGVWELLWKPEDTKLNVKPGTSQEGTSVATLTWSLQTTP